MDSTMLLFLLFVLGVLSNLVIADDQTGRQVSSPSASFSSTAESKEAVLEKFQRAYKRRDKGNRSLPLASISITEDCSAQITCGNGTKLECSIKGPSTSCNSDASGVACFKENNDGSVSGSSGSC